MLVTLLKVHVIITINLTNIGWRFFAFFSYWALVFTMIMFGLALTTSILEIFLYRFRQNKAKKIQFMHLQSATDIFTFLRNRALVISFIHTIFVTGAFWIFLPVGQDYHYYSTIGAHIVSIILNFLEWMLIVLYISWWDLLILLGTASCYYLFTVYIFFQRNVWMYDLQDPTRNSTWYLIIVIGIAVYFGLYFLLRMLNFIKNKFEVYVRWKMNEGYDLTFKRLPEIDYRTYTRNQFLMILTILFANACFSVYINISLLMASRVPINVIAQICYEIIYILIEIGNISFGLKAALSEKVSTSLRVMNWVRFIEIILVLSIKFNSRVMCCRKTYIRCCIFISIIIT